MYDLNGDNKLDIVEADSSGELRVLNADGTPLQSFNHGQPVRTATYPNVHPGAPVYQQVDPPREVLRTPAIGDIDGDREPEIVDSAGEHVYAWHADGTAVHGFPVRLDPAFSLPQDRTRQNHVKRGFIGLADARRPRRRRQAGHRRSRRSTSTFTPGTATAARCRASRAAARGQRRSASGAESRSTRRRSATSRATASRRSSIADERGRRQPRRPAPHRPSGARRRLRQRPHERARQRDRRRGPHLRARRQRQRACPGWPTKPNGVVPDALPFVGPGVDHVHGRRRRRREARGRSANVASGDVDRHERATAANAVAYDSAAGRRRDRRQAQGDQPLREPDRRRPRPASPGLEVIKGGVTLDQLVNIGVATARTSPTTTSSRPGTARPGRSCPASRRRSRTTSSCRARRWRTSPTRRAPRSSSAPASTACATSTPQGVEGAGWPKFTGGWIFATPGDRRRRRRRQARGRGQRRARATRSCGTRTAPPAARNDQWWTSRHDEWYTGDYATDSRPPGSPTGLTATRNPTNHSVTVSWKQPGDDWLCGSPSRYKVITSQNPIHRPVDGSIITVTAAAGTVHDAVSRTFTQAKIGAARYVAVLYGDDAGNWGLLRSTAVPAQ